MRNEWLGYGRGRTIRRTPRYGFLRRWLGRFCHEPTTTRLEQYNVSIFRLFSTHSDSLHVLNRRACMAIVSIAGTLPGFDRDAKASETAEMSLFTSIEVELFACRGCWREAAAGLSPYSIFISRLRFSARIRPLDERPIKLVDTLRTIS